MKRKARKESIDERSTRSPRTRTNASRRKRDGRKGPGNTGVHHLTRIYGIDTRTEINIRGC